MRRDIIKNVEIVEPPIEELTRKYTTFSTIKRTCLGGCGCLVLVIIALAVVLRFAMGSGPTTLNKLPTNFPSNIPIYDKDNIERITFVSGKYKNRGVEIAAFFPKLILSPLFLSLDKNQIDSATSSSDGRTERVKDIWKIISTPVSDHRDTVQIEWTNLDAEPSFIISYYKKELQKNNYKINIESEGENVRQFSFSQGNVSGSVFTRSEETDHAGTDLVMLTVNVSASEE